MNAIPSDSVIGVFYFNPFERKISFSTTWLSSTNNRTVKPYSKHAASISKPISCIWKDKDTKLNFDSMRR